MDLSVISTVINELTPILSARAVAEAGAVLKVVSEVVAACAAITAAVPAPKNPFLAKAWAVLNWIGLNIYNAKNAA